MCTSFNVILVYFLKTFIYFIYNLYYMYVIVMCALLSNMSFDFVSGDW